jgi:TrpR-related protein YerC/YecD
MENTWDNKQSQALFQAILSLTSLNEAKRFFRDLLTDKEIIEFATRWQAAQMLAEGVPYSTIEKQTGLSSATVARISKWLNSGMGGYKLMLSRLHHSHHSLISPGGKRMR